MVIAQRAKACRIAETERRASVWSVRAPWPLVVRRTLGGPVSPGAVSTQSEAARRICGGIARGIVTRRAGTPQGGPVGGRRPEIEPGRPPGRRAKSPRKTLSKRKKTEKATRKEKVTTREGRRATKKRRHI